MAVDQEMVNEIHKMDEFIPIENEKFLYTSLCVRRYGLCATRSNLLVTDKRIIFGILTGKLIIVPHYFQ